MRSKAIVLSAISGILLAGFSTLHAQTPVASNRVVQQVVIRGQRADAAYVLAPTGGIQSYTCPSPEQYATPDGASQGWACYDAATSVWLLSALPPAQQAPAPAPAVIQQPVQQQVQQQVYQPVVIQPVYQQPVYSPSVGYYSYYEPYPTVIYREPSRVIYSTPYYYSRPTLSIGIGIGRSSHDDHRVETHVVNNRGGRR